ncbi:MAG: DUF190 domain-containing protein [Nitrospinae bacterium]|nr:DUF190 domain-containing protein [Nitrospinota bacterium]
MATLTDGKRIAIYIGEADRYEGKPLYRALLHAAKEAGVSGGMVIRGVESFGASGVHTARLLRLSEDLPLVVHFVCEAERIDRLVPVLDRIMEEAGVGGVLTVTPIAFARYAPAGQ